VEEEEQAVVQMMAFSHPYQGGKEGEAAEALHHLFLASLLLLLREAEAVAEVAEQLLLVSKYLAEVVEVQEEVEVQMVPILLLSAQNQEQLEWRLSRVKVTSLAIFSAEEEGVEEGVEEGELMKISAVEEMVLEAASRYHHFAFLYFYRNRHLLAIKFPPILAYLAFF